MNEQVPGQENIPERVVTLDDIMRQLAEVLKQMDAIITNTNRSLKSNIAEIHDIIGIPYKRSAE
jgi:hypothetical protein